MDASEISEKVEVDAREKDPLTLFPSQSVGRCSTVNGLRGAQMNDAGLLDLRVARGLDSEHLRPTMGVSCVALRGGSQLVPDDDLIFRAPSVDDVFRLQLRAG